LGGQKREEYGADADEHPERGLPPGAAGGQYSQQWQVRRHREVFEYKHGQHRWGLSVAQPVQISEQPGDDSRGGDPGRPGQGQNADWLQPEQPAGDCSRYRVEDHVDPRGGQVPAQAVGELAHRELQPQGQQQQHDADRRTDLNERASRGHRCDAPLSKSQTRQ
jgi:hypothetical protein